MWKRLALLAGLALAGASLIVFAQPTDNPWWRPLGPHGASAGVTYGTTRPSLATHGVTPGGGELMVDMDANGTNHPGLIVYDGAAGAWVTMPTGTGTANTVAKWDAAGDLGDSTITDDGTDVVSTGSLFTVGGAVGDTNSIQLDGATGNIYFEGAVDGFEGAIYVASVGQDQTYNIADYGLAAVNAFISVGGVIPNNPNCVWADNNEITYEGATGNDFETHLMITDPTADRNVVLPDWGGNVMVIPLGADAIVANDDVRVQLGTAGADFIEFDTDFLGGTVIDTGAGGLTIDGVPFSVETGGAPYNPVAGVSYLYVTATDISLSPGEPLLAFLERPAANAGGDILELQVTPLAMDAVGGDVINAFLVDVVSGANHAGGSLNGIFIDDIVQDAQAVESALYIDSGWDYAINMSAGAATMALPNQGGLTIRDLASNDLALSLTTTDGADTFGFGGIAWATANFVELTPTLQPTGTQFDILEEAWTTLAMDGGDTQRGVFIDITNTGNHAGANNYLYGIDIDTVVEDTDALEGAIHIGAGWDGHFVITHLAAAPTDNPAAGDVAIFVDDNVDYSGGGGNDCALVARTSAGAVASLGIIVLNGACP